MEIMLDGNARLDKVCVTGMRVTNFMDMARLVDEGFVHCEVGRKDECYAYTANGERFTYVGIKHKEGEELPFDLFEYKHGNFGFYGKLEMSVRNAEYGNLVGLSPEEYRLRIYEAVRYIEENFGIEMEDSNLRYSYLEVNKTFLLNRKFDEYKRCFALMYHLLFVGKAGKEMDFVENQPTKGTKLAGKKNTGYTASKGHEEEIVIYNKSLELQKNKGIQLDKDYMRVEQKMKKSRKIMQALKKNKVDEISTELLNKYFNRFVKKIFEEPYNTRCKKTEIELAKILKEVYVPGSHWTKKILDRLNEEEEEKKIPIMLDIDELKHAMKRFGLNKEQRKNSTKSLKKCCAGMKSFRKFVSNEQFLYEEILEKLRCPEEQEEVDGNKGTEE